MGCNLKPGGAGASFRVWAPHAQSVQVLIRRNNDANYQPLDLARDAAGSEYWSADVSGVGVDEEYRFRMILGPGRAYEHVDPYAREVSSSDGNAASWAVDPTFAWKAFRSPYFENFIIYQCQIGSFAGRNDDPAEGITVNNETANFRDVIKKLPYVKSMDFTAIQFLPAGEFPLDQPEGYAPTNFFAPESSFGSPADLRALVDACHGQGLAVIFDLIYNHVPDSGDNLWEFDGPDPSPGGIYIAGQAGRTDWGWRPDLGRDPVRAFFLDNARMWFREFGADGLRFDSAHNIYPIDKMGQLMSELASEFPDKFLIAEFDNPTYALANYAFDGAWDMGSADAFLQATGNAPLDSLQALINNPGVPQQYSLIRYLLGSHDQIYSNYVNGGTEKPNNRYFVERVGGVMVGRDQYDARSKARMGWALNVAIPGTPMLFMGTEVHHYGYWDPIQDENGDHRFDWALRADAKGREMVACVGDANRVRLAHAALQIGRHEFTHFDPTNRVLAFKRWNDQGDVVLVVVNCSGNKWSDAIYGVSTHADGAFEEIFNSQSPQYGGWNDSGNYGATLPTQSDGKIYIRLPEWSTLMFRRR
jgi:1,4-alpha-glucan branching enzyme